MRNLRWLACCTLIAGCSRGAVGALPVPANPNLEATALSRSAQYSGVPFGHRPGSEAATFKELYVFQGPPDGANPKSDLLNVGGTLYGTTANGGTRGYGTVFTITKSGSERVLYSFTGRPDASIPLAGLTELSGTLYGTTQFGGASDNYGTVFSITPSGKEKVLHSFGNAGDGSYPEAGLIAVNGVLYGTTATGGATGGVGTVFSITPSGKEKVLHTFYEHTYDGFGPQAPLVNLNGTLYGTTSFGSTYDDGVVFSITPAGKEKVLHAFLGSGYSDGAWPLAGLIAVNGVLYGTTAIGGVCRVERQGCGTVYSITPAGAESIVYNFPGTLNGINPQAGLLNVNGTLYGTTINTAFKLTTSGTQTVLHRFDGSKGFEPVASLIDVGGTLYGTTQYTTVGTGTYGIVYTLAP